MAAVELFWRLMYASCTFEVDDSETALVAFWIVPPLPAEPLPVTLIPPTLPVLLRRMPLAAPFDETLRNFRPAPPIVVFWTLTPVPVVVVRMLPFPVAVTVPPPVAVNASLAPELMVNAPLNAIVAPVLALRKMPCALPLMLPPNDLRPAVVFCTCTGRADVVTTSPA